MGIASAIVGVVGAVAGSRSASKAAKSQSASARRAEELQREQFEQSKERLDPFISGATGGFLPGQNPYGNVTELQNQISALESAMGTQEDYPGKIDFRKQQWADGHWNKYKKSKSYKESLGKIDELKSKLKESQIYEADREKAGGANVITGTLNLQRAQSGALGPEMQQLAYDQFKESPGVMWQREQGMRSIEGTLAATGRGGGSRLQAVSEFNQGIAMQDFSNQFNRLGTITGTGLAAAQALSGVGSQAAQGQAQAALIGGAAQAGGALARGQAISSGLSAIGGAIGGYSAGGGGGTPAPGQAWAGGTPISEWRGY